LRTSKIRRVTVQKYVWKHVSRQTNFAASSL